MACAILGMGSSLYAQEVQEEIESSPYPTQGVRFVVCSPTHARVSSKLYAKVGNEYLPYRIASRMPSERAIPSGDGLIKFYDEKPTDVTKNSDTKKPPLYTIKVPADYAKRSLCIIVPGAKPDDELQTYFLKEKDFPAGGIYLVNFSPSPLEMYVAENGEFTDDDFKNISKKKKIIAPFRRTADNGIPAGAENTWSMRIKKGASRKEATTSFVLNAAPAVKGQEPIRIKTGRLMLQPKIAQLSIVVKHPTMPNVYQLISIQYNNEGDRVPRKAA